MRGFNHFINSVLENKLLRSSEIVSDFLTKNTDDFHIIKLQYKNTSKITVMKDFQTLSGELDTTYYPDKYKTSLIIQKNITNKKNLYTNLHNCLKEVITEIDSLSNKMKNLSIVFNDLSTEYKKENENNEIFENFGKICEKIGTIYKKEKNFYEIEVKEFFKYVNLELEEIEKMCKKNKYAKINFEDCENKLIGFEESKKLNYGDDEELFQLELKRKQVEKLNAKRTYHFLLNITCEEYQRIINSQTQRIRKHFNKNKNNLFDLYQNEFSNLLNMINAFEIFDGQ